MQLRLAIPALVRRPDGFVAYVIESDSVSQTGRWVGPFDSASAVARWIETRALEIEEWLTPLQLGLPAELAVLRPVTEQAAACRAVTSR